MNEPDELQREGNGSAGRGDLWPMGAVTRRTGIGEHTLRAWERRFGFPRPHRLPSGHRRYSAEQVQHLLLINEALRCGYRAGDVVPLSRERLEELLREAGRAEVLVQQPTPEWMRRVLQAAEGFDRERVVAQLRQGIATLGVRRFLEEQVAPLLEEMGAAWQAGTLDVRHEHFLSEILQDVLRGERAVLEASCTGRPLVLGTLPREQHSLGIQMAALVIAAAGRTLRLLGPDTPKAELAAAAQSLDASVVGISISAHGVNEETQREVAELRRALPSRIELWLGGHGAGQLEGLPAGVRVFDDLEALDRALRELPD